MENTNTVCKLCTNLKSTINTQEEIIKILVHDIKELQNEMHNILKSHPSSTDGHTQETWSGVVKKTINKTNQRSVGPSQTGIPLSSNPYSVLSGMDGGADLHTTASEKFHTSKSYPVRRKTEELPSTRNDRPYQCKAKLESSGQTFLVADSHGRGISTWLVNNSPHKTISFVKPGAKLNEVIQPCMMISDTLTKNDNVVIIGGTNDVSKNEAEDAMKTLESSLPNLMHTNVIVATLPYRYDLSDESCVNLKVIETNAKILRLCNTFENVKVLDLHCLSRSLHTRHGLHLNASGNKYLCETLCKIIDKISDQGVSINQTLESKNPSTKSSKSSRPTVHSTNVAKLKVEYYCV